MPTSRNVVTRRIFTPGILGSQQDRASYTDARRRRAGRGPQLPLDQGVEFAIAGAARQMYQRVMSKFTCLLFSVFVVVPLLAVDPVPEGMHGVSGLISARMIEKDNERGTIVMKVEKVHRLWRGNKAKNAGSGEGKTLKLTGITGKALDQLLVIRKGDRFSIEIKHVSGPNLRYLGEGLKRLNEDELPAETLGEDSNPRRHMHGFRGIFIGTLAAKDSEKGTLSVKIESIKKTWKKNKAKHAAKAKGQVWEVRGVSGKWLDVLVESKLGERLEVEAFHNRGNKLDFVGEWLKKAE